MKPFRIQVPATSANLGLGFDSVGLALPFFLQVDVIEEHADWYIEHKLGEEIPRDESNLMIQIAQEICPEIVPHFVSMTSNIPIARGLGSSSSVIVAGIELANMLGGLNLTTTDKINLAAKIEGHPDNVAPAILGDLVVAVTEAEKTIYLNHRFPDVDIIVIIPKDPLLTEESRSVLPQALVHEEAVRGSAYANVFLLALIAENWHVVKEVMEKDLFHEKYRLKLTPYLKITRQYVRKYDGYGAVLSGAGPSVLALSPKGIGTQIAAALQADFPEVEVHTVQSERTGVKVMNLDSALLNKKKKALKH